MPPLPAHSWCSICEGVKQPWVVKTALVSMLSSGTEGETEAYAWNLDRLVRSQEAGCGARPDPVAGGESTGSRIPGFL